jgi:hypothetical protein
MRLMLPTEGAELFQLNPLRGGSLIFRFAVVSVLAFTALELNNFTWHNSPAFLL